MHLSTPPILQRPRTPLTPGRPAFRNLSISEPQPGRASPVHCPLSTVHCSLASPAIFASLGKPEKFPGQNPTWRTKTMKFMSTWTLLPVRENRRRAIPCWRGRRAGGRHRSRPLAQCRLQRRIHPLRSNSAAALHLGAAKWADCLSSIPSQSSKMAKPAPTWQLSSRSKN